MVAQKRVPDENIDEALIQSVVHAFYARIRADADLGPIFQNVLAGRWDAHLEKMCAFWSSVMLTSGRYKGNPVQSHQQLADVCPAHFAQWLHHFRETVDDLCSPEHADLFMQKAERIAESLQIAMFYNPAETVK